MFDSYKRIPPIAYPLLWILYVPYMILVGLGLTFAGIYKGLRWLVGFKECIDCKEEYWITTEMHQHSVGFHNFKRCEHCVRKEREREREYRRLVEEERRLFRLRMDKIDEPIRRYF